MIGRDGLHRNVLLDIIERAGGEEATSYLTTGNISFRVEPVRLDDIVATIEAELESVVGRPTPVMVRSLDHLLALVDREPFDDAPHPDPKALLVGMVRHRVNDSFEVPIVSPKGDYHVFAVDGGEVFSITIDNGGRVQDPGGLIERMVGEPLTTRAWGTITKIVDRLRSQEEKNSGTLSPGRARGADPRV